MIEHVKYVNKRKQIFFVIYTIEVGINLINLHLQNFQLLLLNLTELWLELLFVLL